MAYSVQTREQETQAAQPSSPESAADKNMRVRWLILTGLILAAIMEVLDTTIINVALPQMAGNLGTTTQEIAWVSTGYILSNVIVLPITAFLTTKFGRRNYLTGSIALFTASSLLCALSHSLGEMVLWRILQGAAGAALISTAQASLVQVFPPKEQAIVQPLFFMGIVVAPTLGPALGGYLTDTLSWHWCFLINVPIGIIAGALVFACLRDTEAARSDESVDWLGIGLLTAGLGSLQYILEEGEIEDWFQSALIVRLTVLSAVFIVSLILWELSPKNKNPAVDLRVMRNSSLAAGIVLFIATGFGLYGVTYLYPLLAQSLLGMTPLQTGMALLPGGLASAVSILFCATLLSQPNNKVDPRALILVGITLSVIAMWQLGHLSTQATVGTTYWPLVIRGLSIGFLFIPINQTAIASLRSKDVGQGVSLLGLGRQLGGSFGTALLATYLNTHMRINRAYMVVYLTPTHHGFTERLSAMASSLMTHGYSLMAAQHAALGLLDQAMMQQVSMISYNETFLVLLLISLGTAPAVFLLRKPKAGASSGGMMH